MNQSLHCNAFKWPNNFEYRIKHFCKQSRAMVHFSVRAIIHFFVRPMLHCFGRNWSHFILFEKRSIFCVFQWNEAILHQVKLYETQKTYQNYLRCSFKIAIVLLGKNFLLQCKVARINSGNLFSFWCIWNYVNVFSWDHKNSIIEKVLPWKGETIKMHTFFHYFARQYFFSLNIIKLPEIVK